LPAATLIGLEEGTMRRAGRSVLAVVAGAAVWAVLWVAGTSAAALAFPEVLRPGEPLLATMPLVVLIGYSMILSAAAGYTTASVAGVGGERAVWWLAGIQFGLGVVIEGTSWSMTPVWYHLVFLASLVPATLWGGGLRLGSVRPVPVRAGRV
jgi:hypothetical protein